MGVVMGAISATYSLERDLMSPSGSTDDLDYMHARHYNLNLGRFLTPDPAPADPAVPQSWNAYAYVLNNPLKYTDPFGLTEADQMRGDCDDSAAGDSECVSGSNFKQLRAQLWLQAQRLGLTSLDVNTLARKLESNTYFASFDGSFAFYAGGAVEGGIYLNPQNKEGRFDLGLLADAGFATGRIANGGLTFGVLFGNSAKLDGPFGEVNFAVGSVAGSIMTDHSSGQMLGITLGPAEGFGLAITGRQGSHFSLTESLRSAALALDTWIWQRYTTPFSPLWH